LNITGATLSDKIPVQPQNTLAISSPSPQLVKPETVEIQAGSFSMGSRRSEDVAQGDWPLRQVYLEKYAIGKFPVTNEEYAAFVQDNYPNRSPRGVGWLNIYPPPKQGEYPVVGITWDDAWAYCEWLTQKTHCKYRLPTEAEWEKAARGDRDERLYPWGDEPSPGHKNFSSSQTHEVGKYPQNRSPFGCYDMVGHIYEWTATIWGYDAGEAHCAECVEKYDEDKIKEHADAFHVGRGGPVQDAALRLGCSVRYPFSRSTQDSKLGFRVVLELNDRG
jgi:iron(II)-dependent oxidoreductase